MENVCLFNVEVGQQLKESEEPMTEHAVHRSEDQRWLMDSQVWIYGLTMQLFHLLGPFLYSLICPEC